MTLLNKPRPRRAWPPLRPALVLAGAVIGIATSFFTALALVPRVRLVDVLTVFAGAVGGGAGLAYAAMEFRKAVGSTPRR